MCEMIQMIPRKRGYHRLFKGTELKIIGIFTRQDASGRPFQIPALAWKGNSAREERKVSKGWLWLCL